MSDYQETASELTESQEKSTSFLVNKHLLALFLVCLSISTLTGFELINVLATPSPTINRLVTPGNMGPCTWFISLDGTTPTALAMVSGLSVSVGDFLVGTAGQGIGSFLNTNLVITSGQVYCFSAQTFTVDQTIIAKTNTGFYGGLPSERSSFGSPLTAFNVASNIYGSDPFGVFDLSNTKDVTMKDIAIWGGCSGFGAIKCRGIATKVSTSYTRYLIFRVSFYDLSIGIYAGNGPGLIENNYFDTIQDYPVSGEGEAIDLDGGTTYVITGNIMGSTIKTSLNIITGASRVTAMANIFRTDITGGNCVVQTGVAANVTVVGNTCYNTTGGSAPFSWSATCTNCFLTDNAGINPQGGNTVTPSFPVTGVDQANTNPYRVNICIAGTGTGVTAVGITDRLGGLTNFPRTVAIGDCWSIDPNGKIRFTYTGSPSWKWFGT